MIWPVKIRRFAHPGLCVAVAVLAVAMTRPAASQSQAETQTYDVTSNWTQICQSPCIVRVLGLTQAQIYAGSTVPSGASAPSTIIGSTLEAGLPVTGAQSVYARAFGTGVTARVVVLPYGTPSSAPSSPTYTTPAGVTRTRQTCTLPAYATGGNIVCTDQAGAQTTTACAANTACLVSAANPNRKVAEFTNRTAGSTIDVGYSATTAPGNSKGYDGPSATNGQGGSGTENPAHVGAYYAATATAGAVLVFVQGQ